jgi:hypothetical protein
VQTTAATSFCVYASAKVVNGPSGAKKWRVIQFGEMQHTQFVAQEAGMPLAIFAVPLAREESGTRVSL